MKVLLIYPTPISVLPYGVLYIADVFRRNNCQTKLLVNTFKKPYATDDFLQAAAEFKPDIVGLSFATLDILNVYDLIKKIKKDSGAVVICGGPHPSCRPDEVLSNDADIVVNGEGELTAAELGRLFAHLHKNSGRINLFAPDIQQDLEAIDGISYRDSMGLIKHNSPRARNVDLNSLPIPDFGLLDPEPFMAADGTLKGFNKIENGRGCPNQCTFCDRSVFGNRYINKLPERIIEDISFLKTTYGYTDFYFTDDTFTINNDYVTDVCDRIISSGLDISWACATRVNTVTPKTISKMKEAGCRRIIFGVESGDNDWLRRTRKGFTVDIAIRALNHTFEAGIETHVNLMYGFPWETPEHIENQIRFVKYAAKLVNIFQTYGALIPYPNTAVFDEYRDEYNLEGWWLRERYQNCGQVIYQNVLNPYKVSTFYHRNLHDDTYVYEDYFFNFSREYKKKVRELAFLLGRHNLKSQYHSKLVQNLYYYTGLFSRHLFEINPYIEKKIAGSIGIKNRLHDFRKIGEFIKQ